ncbi:hypothetical protein EG835_12910, partial [bacterium]|nr:hypothetical protein [bacterium]
MSDSDSNVGVNRYRSLGLVANPFRVPDVGRGPTATALEVGSAANRLLAQLDEASRQDAPRPILVTKSTAVPSAYSLRAISAVERELVRDESMNLLHAYVQLYMMRRGRVRSTLGIVGERLAFHSFEETLASYIDGILDEADVTLASFGVLGP